MRMLATILISVMTAMAVTWLVMRRHERKYHATPCACKSNASNNDDSPGMSIQPVGGTTPLNPPNGDTNVGDVLRTLGAQV